jgi:hypothetical protein
MGIRGALAVAVIGSALLVLLWISMTSWIGVMLFGVFVLMIAVLTIWYMREVYDR